MMNLQKVRQSVALAVAVVLLEVSLASEKEIGRRIDTVALPPSPKDHRDCLRHVERRPVVSDPVAYAELLAAERANVVTLGTMYGTGTAFFPTELATADPRMNPNYLPTVIDELRKRDMHVMSWVVFNAQDIRNLDDFQPIKRFPQWQMRYIDEPGVQHRPRVGMCVVSSPYIEHHGRLLQQAAAFDIDGFFFDGFYFGGIPHPARPGCVCEFCHEKFREDTGMELPAQIDWTSATFKRWVRWRNERLLAVARYFQDRIREVNRDATCTFNTNLWPFGNKDWETAIPMWRIEGFGVSQHGYSSRFHEKWMMLGFKARLGRDMNPQHTDMWRHGELHSTCGAKDPDWAWHELEMLTFVLTGPTHGITPWHSTITGPVEITARIHTLAALREPYFSRKYVCDVGVLCSQNTHDFYGHLPGTNHLADYRDGLIGTWMLLCENHIPFEFVFDNQIDRQALQRYQTLILPNTACLSEQQANVLAEWKQSGGRLITTADTGRYDEWGGRRESRPLTKMVAVHFETDPGLIYCRDRSETADALVRAILDRPMPLAVDGPPHLVANMFVNPKNDRECWIHLLNVSHLMPEGDSGFRGLNRAPTPRRASLSESKISGFGAPLVPVENARLRIRDYRPVSARLAISHEKLRIDSEGWVVVPRVELHDVVVVETQ